MATASGDYQDQRGARGYGPAKFEETSMSELHRYDTTRRFESIALPGVSVVLKKMTEGRRLELRKLISEPNKRIRDIMREQVKLEKIPEVERDIPQYLDLMDEFDGIMIEKIDPAWITWGVKQVEGLVVDGRTLGVEDWPEWPSSLFREVVDEVKSEAELNGAERKNSELRTISGEPVGSIQKPLTAVPAKSGDGGAVGTADSTLPIV